MRRRRPPRQVCGFLLWVSLTLPFGTALRPFGGEPAQASLPVLTQVEQILQLSLEEARKQYPVRIEASVTLSDDDFKLLFVQDGTAGVFVNGLSPQLALTAEQRLVIQGVTGPGLLSPIVDRASGELIGPGAFPEPWRIGIGELITGRADAQFVEVEGIVQIDEVIAGRRRLEIVSGLNRCKAWLMEAGESYAPSHVDARVRVRGVCGAQHSRNGRLDGFQLYVARSSDISVVEAPPSDAFSKPVILARDFSTYAVLRTGQHRIRVQGAVTVHWPSRRLVIEDDTGGISLLEASQSNRWRVGDWVDAVGFRTLDSTSPQLQAAVVREAKAAQRQPPDPILVTQKTSATLENRLVHLDAELVHLSLDVPGQIALGLKAGAQSWTALLQMTGTSTARMLQSGARLRLTGVCQLPSLADHPRSGPLLWLRSPADIQVLFQPSLQNRPARMWEGAPAMGFVAGLAALSSFWIWRRAGRKAEHDRRASEEELRGYIEERERIGQDMHDNVIQSVYAVGLGLEDCRRSFRHSPAQMEQRLGTAINALNGVMGDVRQFIGGLEPKALNGHELKTALKSLALTTGDSSSQFRIQVDAAATRILTTQQATHLLNIAKEAMSNSLRHAKARQTVVAVSLAQGKVRLEVSDDGVGFDPRLRPPDAAAGLRNIAARARDLDGTLNVVSTPGEGTRIIVAVPTRT